jgi:hypothetical protein
LATKPAPKTVSLKHVLSKAARSRSLFKRLLRNPGKTLAAEGLALNRTDLGRLNRARKLLRGPIQVTLRRGDVVPKRIRIVMNGDWNPEWPTEWARTTFAKVGFTGAIKFRGPR